MKLGDSRTLKSLSVEVGSIFKMTLRPEDGVTPKNACDTDRTKYFAIIGVTKDKIMVASLLVNSSINGHLFNIIGPYQHRILSSDYAFLTKAESYFDCYKIKELPSERIVKDGEYVGPVAEDDLKAIIDLVVKSPANRQISLEKYNLIK